MGIDSWQIQLFISNLLSNQVFFMFFIGTLFAFVLFLLLFIAKKIIKVLNQTSTAFHKSILLIKVPKERKGDDSKSASGEDSLNQTREQIAIVETLFSSIAGLKPEKGLGRWLFGSKNNFSFEIVVKDNKISFYMAVPDKYRNFMEQQIHAQYSDAEITEVPDYNIFEADSQAVGANLIFKNNFVLS